MSDESVLVDQVVAGKRLDERRPAMGEQVFPWLALEPGDLIREVAADDLGIDVLSIADVQNVGAIRDEVNVERGILFGDESKRGAS